MNIIETIANELNVKQSQVEKTIELIDGGNTIPFIARYRKEVTGNLSDEQLRNLNDRLTYLRNLDQRKSEVTTSIENQGKLTEEIINDLEKAVTLAEVEDIYRPYKQKKKTRAIIAKQRGLEPLATTILEQKCESVIDCAKEYISEEVPTEQDAIQGAKDIIAEMISDDPDFRKKINEYHIIVKGIIETGNYLKEDEKIAL